MIEKSVETNNVEWHGFVVIEEGKNCLKVEADIFKRFGFKLRNKNRYTICQTKDFAGLRKGLGENRTRYLEKPLSQYLNKDL